MPRGSSARASCVPLNCGFRRENGRRRTSTRVRTAASSSTASSSSSGRVPWPTVCTRPGVKASARDTLPDMAVTITWETLRELAGFHSDQGCALSLYLDLDPSTSPTPAVIETRLNSLLSEVEKNHLADDDDGQRKRAIRADLERVREWWDSDFDRDGARGLAVFVSAGDSYWRELPLSQPVRDHFHVDTDLALAPLVPHVNGHEGALVAVMNRERGQIIRLRA